VLLNVNLGSIRHHPISMWPHLLCRGIVSIFVPISARVALPASDIEFEKDGAISL